MTSESRTLNCRSIVFSEKFRLRPPPLSPPSLSLSIYFALSAFHHGRLVIANYFNSRSSITLVLVRASSASVASEGKRGTSGTRGMPRDIKWRKEVFERGGKKSRENENSSFSCFTRALFLFPPSLSLFLPLSRSFPPSLSLPVCLPPTHPSCPPPPRFTVPSTVRNYVYVP